MTVVIDGNTGIDTIQANTVTSAKIVDGTVTPADTQVGALPSMVRVNTANGYGSTNTKIRRFTNVVTNQGSDITYADSATLGASFTINTNGVYSFSFSFGGSITMDGGLSINTTAPTTSIIAIPIAEVLAQNTCGLAGGAGIASWTGYLTSGAVVRPHTDGASSSGSRFDTFTITRTA
jgi:hypothetical protein